MAPDIVLRFHTRVLRTLDVTPSLSSAQVSRLEQREAACGVLLPASVKEWFSLVGVHRLFRENTNQDELVPTSKIADPADVKLGYLKVATENQGVVGFYLKLDGSEDPPVFHNDDDWDSPLDEVAWVEVSESFSEFLVDMMLG